eukprot:tig00021374_g21120.t1
MAPAAGGQRRAALLLLALHVSAAWLVLPAAAQVAEAFLGRGGTPARVAEGLAGAAAEAENGSGAAHSSLVMKLLRGTPSRLLGPLAPPAGAAHLDPPATAAAGPHSTPRPPAPGARRAPRDAPDGSLVPVTNIEAEPSPSPSGGQSGGSALGDGAIAAIAVAGGALLAAAAILAGVLYFRWKRRAALLSLGRLRPASLGPVESDEKGESGPAAERPLAAGEEPVRPRPATLPVIL